MSGLPPKPELRTSSGWTETGDDRHYGGRPAPVASPEHYRPRRDDRDRERNYHPPRSPSPPRSPPPRRESGYNSRKDSSRGYYDSYHRDERSRGDRGWEPDRRTQDRRDDRAWVRRNEYRGRGRGRGRDRGRGSPSRGYDNDDGYGGGWRGRDSERYRDRDSGGRGRSRDYDRYHYDRRKFDDRSPERPSMHKSSYSPRRDSRERRSRTRSPRYSTSPRRHSRPNSPEGNTYRPSSRGPAKHDPDYSPMPRSRFSEHRGTRSCSPRRSRQPSLPRAIKAEAQDDDHVLGSPARSLRSLHSSDEKKPLPLSPRVKTEYDSGHVGRSPVSSSRIKEEPVDRDFKMRDRSPMQELQIPRRSYSPNPGINALVKTPSTPISPAQSLMQTVPEESTADIPKPPTAPYLPSFPKRQTVKERLGSKYREELSNIEAVEAIRARAAAEHSQISKAIRRALHELDLTTMDLRTAQSRREHAENHRKKAAAGFLDMEAEFSTAP